MYLLITGFLPEESGDDSLKYELAVPADHERQVTEVLGWKGLAEEGDGELLLDPEQVNSIAQAIQESLPNDLDLFIGIRSA